MSRSLYGNLDLVTNQILNVRLQMLGSAPSPLEALIYYDSTLKAIRYYDGSTWKTLGEAGAGGPPSGGIVAGDLVGSSYPSPLIAAGVVTDTKIATANKDGAAATPSMRTLGTGAAQAAAGNDSRFGAASPPNGAAGGDLTGTYPNPTIAAGVIIDADVNASAAIAQTKIAGLAASFTAKVDTTRTITAGNGLTGTSTLASDVTLAVGSGTGITVSADAIAADLSVLQARSEKGVANGYAPLDAGAMIATAFLPPLAVNEVFTAANQAAMLALTAQRGDMCIRTDLGTSWVLSADTPTVLAAWKEVMAAGQVTSVNSQTGVVSITAASISAAPTSRTITAGNGLTQTGTTLASDFTLNVVGDATLSVGADSIGVVSAPKWTTARTITLGTDLTGSVSIDGSANVTLNATLAAGAGGKRYAVTLGTASPQTVTHNLNTRDCIVQVYNTASPYEQIDVEVQMTTLNTVTLIHNPALPAGYRAVVTA